MQAATTADHALLSRIARGDAKAQVEIVDRYFQELARYTSGRFGLPYEDAEEIAQDAILWIIRHPTRYPLEHGRTLYALLVRIARNRALDRLRSARPMLPLSDAEPAEAGGGAEHESDGGGLADMVAAVLSHYPLQDRQMMWWIAAGIQPMQMAAWTQRSPNATRQAVFRLKRRVARDLAMEISRRPRVVPRRVHDAIAASLPVDRSAAAPVSL